MRIWAPTKENSKKRFRLSSGELPVMVSVFIFAQAWRATCTPWGPCGGAVQVDAPGPLAVRLLAWRAAANLRPGARNSGPRLGPCKDQHIWYINSLPCKDQHIWYINNLPADSSGNAWVGLTHVSRIYLPVCPSGEKGLTQVVTFI